MGRNIPEPAGKRGTSLSLLFLIVVIDLLGFAIVLPLLPRYAERFNASGAVIGLLFSSFSAMQFFFAPLWGRLSDRIGRRPVLLVGLLGSVVFYALFGFATMAESLTLMFVSRIGAGIFGATISTAQACIADATSLENRARGMALIGAAFGVGFTFGPILGSLALPHTPVAAGSPEPLNALPGFLASALSLAALIIAYFRLPETLGSSSDQRPHAWLSPAAVRESIRVPSVAMLLALFFLTTFAFAEFEATLSLLTLRSFGMGDDKNFYLFTYIGLTLTIVQGGLVRPLAPRVGEGRLLVAGIALMAVGLWMVTIASDRHSVAWLLAVMPVVVCGFAFITPSVQALISRRSDPSRQGEILGVSQSVASMSRILGPFVGNVLFDHGVRVTYDTAALLLVPALFMAILSLKTGRDWRPDAERGEETAPPGEAAVAYRPE